MGKQVLCTVGRDSQLSIALSPRSGLQILAAVDLINGYPQKALEC
jgi:hypothetical protein